MLLIPEKWLLKNLAHLSGSQEPVDVLDSLSSMTIIVGLLKFCSKCSRCWSAGNFVWVLAALIRDCESGVVFVEMLTDCGVLFETFHQKINYGPMHR